MGRGEERTAVRGTSEDDSNIKRNTNIPDGIIDENNQPYSNDSTTTNQSNSSLIRGHPTNVADAMSRLPLHHRLRQYTLATTNTDLLLRLEDHRHVTTLDISEGYYQTRLHLNDEPTTSTVAAEEEGTEDNNGNDEVVPTPPALFTAENMCVYLDDLVIHTNDSVTHHAEIVTEICTRLTTFGLQLNRPSTRSSPGDL